MTAPEWNRVRRDLASFESTASDELECLSSARLADLVAHHWQAENSHFRRHLLAAGIRERDLPVSISELSRLPTTDKAFIRAGNYSERPAGAVHKIVATSGTTQASVRVPHNYEMSKETLFENFLRLFLLNGLPSPSRFYGIGHRETGQTTSGSFITFDFMNQAFPGECWMAATREPLEQHVQLISAMRVNVIASAPGFLVHLAQFLEGRSIKIRVPTIIVGGAPLLSIDEDILRRVFAPDRIVMFYPTTDAGGLGAEMGGSREYVGFTETHVVEIVRANGRHVDEGEEGDVGVTVLSSRAAPLIRYLVGDSARYLGKTDDGKRVRFDRIRRTTEVIVGDGKIPFADLETFRDALDVAGLHVTAFQLVRRKNAHRKDQLIFRVESEAEHATVLRTVIETLRCNPHMRYLLDDHELPVPRIELFRTGELMAGRFKIPIFLDEGAGGEGT